MPSLRLGAGRQADAFVVADRRYLNAAFSGGLADGDLFHDFPLAPLVARGCRKDASVLTRKRIMGETVQTALQGWRHGLRRLRSQDRHRPSGACQASKTFRSSVTAGTMTVRHDGSSDLDAIEKKVTEPRLCRLAGSPEGCRPRTRTDHDHAHQHHEHTSRPCIMPTTITRAGHDTYRQEQATDATSGPRTAMIMDR